MERGTRPRQITPAVGQEGQGVAATGRKSRIQEQRKGLQPVDTTAPTLIPVNRHHSLVAWFELYMAIEAGAHHHRGSS